MKYVRFLTKDNETRYGILDGGIITPFVGQWYEGDLAQGVKYELGAVRLLCPTVFSKAVCIGLNYINHAKELEMQKPEKPVVFLKPSTSAIGPDDEIIHPSISKRVDFEAELAVVMKKDTKNVSIEDAYDHVLGYTIANDVTARDLQEKGGQWTICKGFDTFLPLGPYICDEINPENVEIESFVNGQLRQKGNTADMIFNVPFLISYISSVMTLKKGDVILTGTPKGIGGMEKGDVVECVIQGLGRLRNKNV